VGSREEKVRPVSTEEEWARQRLRELKDWAEGRGPRCTKCQRLRLPVVYEVGGVCLMCQWPEEASKAEGKTGMEALQVPEGEADVTVETPEFSGEESKEDRRRRLNLERMRRYREARR
jgi:hypothetical protein